MNRNRSTLSVLLGFLFVQSLWLTPQPVSAVEYVITASVEGNGKIDPSGSVSVEIGTSYAFSITPAPHYHISRVLVDDWIIGAVTEYIFNDVQSDHTIRAVFDINRYTISTSTVGNGKIKPPDPIIAEAYSTITFSFVPDPYHYLKDVLVDFFTVGAVPEYTFESIQDNHTLQALFGVDQYTITATANENGWIEPSGTVVVDALTSETFTSVPFPYHHLEEIRVDGETVAAVPEYTFEKIQANHTIHADFAIDKYKIDAFAGENGKIVPSGPITVPALSNETFVCIPDTHYHVNQVWIDGETAGAIPEYTFENVLDNHTIHAYFAIDKYKIEASAGENGKIVPSGSIAVPALSNETFVCIPDAYYHVNQVWIDGETAGVIPEYSFENVLDNHTIHVSFAIDRYTIVTEAGENGKIVPSGPVVVKAIESETFVCVPDPNYHVANVWVDGVSVGPVSEYTFDRIESDHTIRVAFAIDEYTITATTDGNGSIIPSGSLVVEAITSETFVFVPYPHYHLSDVLVDGRSMGPVSEYMFESIRRDHTIHAVFAPDVYTIVASANANGQIVPSGLIRAGAITSETFTFVPNPNCHLEDVLVDGESVGSVEKYTFESIQDNHTIRAVFAPDVYTIAASANANGQIVPSGLIRAEAITSETFTFVPNPNCHLDDVLVDGESVGPVEKYTFDSIQDNHTIRAVFAINKYTITATANENGRIVPQGSIVAEAGTSESFAFVPYPTFHLENVIVDGETVGAVPEYVFDDIQDNHTIHAMFGNQSPTVEFTVELDTWLSGTIVLECEANDGDGSIAKVLYQYSLFGVNWRDIDSADTPPYRVTVDTVSLDTSSLSYFWIRAVAVDNDGAIGVTVLEQTFGIDNKSPFTRHDYNGLWHAQAFEINLTAVDAGGSGIGDTYYRINGGDIMSVSVNGHPKIGTEGPNNTLEYWSVDKVGNEEEHRLLESIKLDMPPFYTVELKKYTVHYIRRDAPVVDGRVDENEYREASPARSEWMNAATSTFQLDSEGTLFKAVYDDQRIYIGVSYRDRDGIKPSRVTADDRGFGAESETVEFYFNPTYDDQNQFNLIKNIVTPIGYQLAVDINPNQQPPFTLTAATDRSPEFNSSFWNPTGIETAIGVYNQRVIVEMAIPFSSLGLEGNLNVPSAPADNTRWAVQVARVSSLKTNRRPVWSINNPGDLTLRPWNIFIFERSDSSIITPDPIFHSNPDPVPVQSLVSFEPVEVFEKLEPLLVQKLNPTERSDDLTLEIEPRVWISNGNPVTFLVSVRSLDLRTKQARLTLKNLPNRIMADFTPQTLTLPGSSNLTVESVGDVTGIQITRLEVIAESLNQDVGSPTISIATGVCFMITDPSLQMTEPIPITLETIPIYLVSDSKLDETVGSTVRIGGRIGAGGIDRFGVRSEKLIPSIDLIVKRGETEPLYVKVPVGKYNRFLVEFPVENQAMLDSVWRVTAQHEWKDAVPLKALSQELVIPVGALASQPSGKRNARFSLEDNVLSELYGNVIVVSGKGYSEDQEASMDRIVRQIYSQFVTGRRFTDETFKVISPRSLPEEGDTPEIAVLSPPDTTAVLNAIQAIPATHPLTLLILAGEYDAGNVVIDDTGQTLDTSRVGEAFQAANRQAPTYVVIDMPQAGAVAQVIATSAGENAFLVCIASTGDTPASIAIFGTLDGVGQPVSFSDYFFDRIIASQTVQDAFDIASNRILEVQGPLALQVPMMVPGEPGSDLVNRQIGSAAANDLITEDVPDAVAPVILQAPGNLTLAMGSLLEIEAWIVDESDFGDELTAGIRIAPVTDEYGLSAVELPMGYDDDRDRYGVTVLNFPESIFNPVDDSMSFVLTIVAEDGLGNTSNPVSSIITLTGERDTPPDQVIEAETVDLNADGEVNAYDLKVFLNTWHESVRSDINNDGNLDALDLMMASFFWKQDVPYD